MVLVVLTFLLLPQQISIDMRIVLYAVHQQPQERQDIVLSAS